jgi:SAM-dependent methyltransferase
MLGWLPTLRETARASWAVDPATDIGFDRQHGTDTSGAVETAELGIGDEQRRSNAIRYLPSPARATQWMLDQRAGDVVHRTFVDIGCGKGRVLLLAAQRRFRRVVGVELSAALVEVARSNVAAYRGPPALIAPVDVVCADATAFQWPGSDLFVHLYHPFQPSVTALLVDSLDASLAHNPRQATIAYLVYTAAAQEVAQCIAGRTSWRLDRYEESVRGTYNWLFFEHI